MQLSRIALLALNHIKFNKRKMSIEYNKSNLVIIITGCTELSTRYLY